jgi:XTP/dITP diphosphohydrolase
VLLLARLAGIPDERRTARYRCSLAVIPAQGEGNRAPELVVDGVTEGRIAGAPRGHHGFGYDPLFLSDELGRTFGEASPTEKDAVSHRARAVKAIIAVLRAPRD